MGEQKTYFPPQISQFATLHRRDEAATFYTSQKSPNDRSDARSYMYWMAIFSGVGAVIAGLLHAAFWKPFSMIFGAIVSLQTLANLKLLILKNVVVPPTDCIHQCAVPHCIGDDPVLQWEPHQSS